MTPDAPASPDPAAGRHIVRVRKKRRRHGRSRRLRDVWIPAAIAVMLLAILAVRYISHLMPPAPVAGYVGNAETLQEEYLEFEGKPLTNSPLLRQFQNANDLAGKGDYQGAAALLESVARKCAVPVVFYDLGLVYAQMNDHDKTVAAFRETLARDPFYESVRTSLATLRGYDRRAADPIASEAEPNDTCIQANLISLGVDVVGEISSESDTDCFRFSAPRSPRDVLRIQIKSQSTSLAPRITIYNAESQPTGEQAESPDAGAPLELLIAPRSNTTLFVEVSGNHQSKGAYALKITPTRSYDSFEPNDEIGAAHRIPTGKDLEANIMWSDDNDYYSFVAERNGRVSVRVEAASANLRPGVALFGPNRQPMEVSADAGDSAMKLTRTIEAAEGQVYYVNVSGRNQTTGSYRLSVIQ